MDEVLFVELKNRPGALARAVEKLARAHIDIRYAYATAHSRAQKTAAVIAVPSRRSRPRRPAAGPLNAAAVAVVPRPRPFGGPPAEANGPPGGGPVRAHASSDYL